MIRLFSHDSEKFRKFPYSFVARLATSAECYRSFLSGKVRAGEAQMNKVRRRTITSEAQKAGIRALLLTAAMLVPAGSAFADCSGQPQHVAGGALTDFIDASHTDGLAIGDLRGAIGVQILATLPNGFHVHHHFVLESGDQIFFDDADVTIFPTSDPNRVVGDYLKGVNITGGTGRFEKATGNIGAWGAVDLAQGKLTLRYEGVICIHPTGGS